jgi:hypothetical protein
MPTNNPQTGEDEAAQHEHFKSKCIKCKKTIYTCACLNVYKKFTADLCHRCTKEVKAKDKDRLFKEFNIYLQEISDIMERTKILERERCAEIIKQRIFRTTPDLLIGGDITNRENHYYNQNTLINLNTPLENKKK